MENIEDIYLQLKQQFSNAMPGCKVAFITLDEAGSHLDNYVYISFNDQEKEISIKALENTLNRADFYAFVQSEKGKQFISENTDSINIFLKGFLLNNAGYLNNTIQVTDNTERMQLVKSVLGRQNFLNNIVIPSKWDPSDSEGPLDECKAAVSRLIKNSKNIKLIE